MSEFLRVEGLLRSIGRTCDWCLNDIEDGAGQIVETDDDEILDCCDDCFAELVELRRQDMREEEVCDE